MDHRDLQAFVALAQRLHFAKAAADSHMTPSTLSRLIRRLEDELGMPLFDRDRRQVRMTYAGEQFRHYAEETLAQWQLLQSRVHSFGTGDLAGQVSLYCSVTASYSVLAGILPRVREVYPRVEINVRTGDQAQALPRLLAGADDLAVAAIPDQQPKGVVFQPLTRSEFCLIAPAIACPLAEQLAVARVDWQNVPFIVPDQGVARQRLEQWWQQCGLQPPVYAHVSGHEAVVSMVALGFGVALVPEIVVRHSPMLPSIRSLALDESLQPFEIGLCALAVRLDRPVVSAVWRLLASYQPGGGVGGVAA